MKHGLLCLYRLKLGLHSLIMMFYLRTSREEGPNVTQGLNIQKVQRLRNANRLHHALPLPFPPPPSHRPEAPRVPGGALPLVALDPLR